MLTKRLRDCLQFIDAYQGREGGVSPSFDEIGAGIGINHKSGVHRLVHELESRGFVRQIAGKRRAIEVLRRPGDVPNPASLNITIPHAGKLPVAVARLCPEGKVS